MYFCSPQPTTDEVLNMATDGPTPTPCDTEIFQKGSGVCVADGSSNAIENWVQKIAMQANARVDWHYSGGRANVLHLGDDESRQRVLHAINDGTILSIEGPTLFRNGVDNVEDAPNAVVYEKDGEMVLHDPDAVAVIRAVEKHNCKNTLEINSDRVEHFKQRLSDRGMTADQAVIVLLNADDVHGGPLADLLMPGTNWQEIRDRGEVPFARGLAMREGIQEVLESFDTDAAQKLHDMHEVAVVVVDHGVAEVFAA
jgi:hypothetical protein